MSMKNCFANKALGFYFALVAAALALIGIAAYGGVQFQTDGVTLLLGISAALMLLATLLSGLLGDKLALRSVTIVNAVLMTLAAMRALSPMINQIGFVVAGLDGFETLSGLVTFEALCLSGVLLNILASFVKYTKAE